jgi:hypothetical protein
MRNSVAKGIGNIFAKNATGRCSNKSVSEKERIKRR